MKMNGNVGLIQELYELCLGSIESDPVGSGSGGNPRDAMEHDYRYRHLKPARDSAMCLHMRREAGEDVGRPQSLTLLVYLQ